jgi:hypothetical protein
MFSQDCSESRRIVDLFFIAGVEESVIQEAIENIEKINKNVIKPVILLKYPPNNSDLTEQHLPVSFKK